MIKKVLMLLITIWILSFQSMAQGDLLITPTRVVFEGNKQKEELSLVNMGKDSATYSISFIQKRMKADGSFINIEVADSGQMFADSYLRIFPRQVTLAPGEPQVIILQCRIKPGMQAGEYRSHLFFRSEKDYTPLGMKKSDKDTALVSVQVTPIFGMSIPIIIRTGAVHVTTTLENLKLETLNDSSQYLKLSIVRTGNISSYGDIVIQYIPEEGKPYQIGAMAGVGVYTNIEKRNVVIKLKNSAGSVVTRGKLKIQYISNNEPKQIVYAEKVIDINK